MSIHESRVLLFQLLRSADLSVKVQPDGRCAWGRGGETWGLLTPSAALFQLLLEAAETSYGDLLFQAALLSDPSDETALARAG